MDIRIVLHVLYQFLIYDLYICNIYDIAQFFTKPVNITVKNTVLTLSLILSNISYTVK